MNKSRLVLLLVLTLLAPQNFSQEVFDVDQLNWQKAFANEAIAMEKRYGVKFDPDWKPLVVFKIPDDIAPQLRGDFVAQYYPETQSFIISPAKKAAVDQLVVKHELVHALVDQISRRIGNGMLPDVSKNSQLEFDMLVGRALVSEGMASYFQYKDDLYYPKDAKGGEGWLPQSFGDFLWRNRDFLYHGGHWLVAPIINKCGEQGIVYLIKHPLRFQNDDVRTAALEYQRVALKKLSRKKCS
ncbi:MAG: hypothetical protein AAB719_02250 [Patescibacteria group bacterium]